MNIFIKILIGFVVFITLLGLAIVLFFIPARTNKVVDDGNNNGNDNVIVYSGVTKDNFNFKYNYKGDNVWEYEIKGQLPTPCYSTKVDALVMESYPEQVRIDLSILEPKPDVMCTQVIFDYEYKDSFSASDKATISFTVNGK